MLSTLKKIWAFVSHTATALAMLDWWHWLSAGGVAAMTIIVAWLEQQPRIILFLAGLISFAMMVFIWGCMVANRRPKSTGNAIASVENLNILRLTQWRPKKAFIGAATSLRRDLSRIKIIYFYQPHFPFAERLAAAFELAGWSVNFNRTAQGMHIPHYRGGIEVRGVNRHLVEATTEMLDQSGCVGTRMDITTNNISQDNPKYEMVQNSIRITIGYEE